MQVSKDIIWAITKERNAFLYKGRYGSFTSDPFSVTNRHSIRHLGFVADRNRVALTADGKGKLNVAFKNKRRTVNAAPALNRKGEANKTKARKNLRSYNFQQTTMNDKNAMNTFAAKCPELKKRITKLHRANLKAAKNVKAATA